MNKLTYTQKYIEMTEKSRSKVDSEFRRIAKASHNSKIEEVILYVTKLNKKRPKIAGMMAEGVYKATGGTNSKTASDIALFTELIMLGTMMIDDIIDNHHIRLSEISPKDKFGLNLTIISATYLAQEGYALLAKYGCQSFEKLREGLVGWMETGIKGKTPQECQKALKNMGGSLGFFTRTASELARAPKNIQQLSKEYGTNLGYGIICVCELVDLKGKYHRPAEEELRHGDDILAIKTSKEYIVNEINKSLGCAEKCLVGLGCKDDNILKIIINAFRESLLKVS